MFIYYNNSNMVDCFGMLYEFPPPPHVCSRYALDSSLSLSLLKVVRILNHTYIHTH